MTKRILVVEDQEDLRGILRDLLTGSGYDVAEAADGRDGVAKALSERPDLILMDIQLPILDGYEATRQIKADPNLNAIPIIAVSSYAMKGDEEKARVRLRPLRDQAPQPSPTLAHHPRVSWRTGVGRTKSGLWVCFRGVHIGQAISSLGHGQTKLSCATHFRWTPSSGRNRCTANFLSFVPCVDGSALARTFFASQAWSEQPCVRPLCAVHMTAGHNALRGSGPGQFLALDSAVARVGCPDLRIDRICITCCSSFQPSHHAVDRRDLVYAARAAGSL